MSKKGKSSLSATFRDFLEEIPEGTVVKWKQNFKVYGQTPQVIPTCLSDIEKGAYGILKNGPSGYWPYNPDTNVLAATRVGYLEFTQVLPDEHNNYHHYYVFEFRRTSKEVIRRTSKKRKKAELYKYNFEIGQRRHKTLLDSKAPWKVQDNALKKMGANPKWEHLPDLGSIPNLRKSLYDFFIEDLKGFRSYMRKQPLLYHIFEGELLLTLAMVKLEEKEDGTRFFKTLSDEEAMEKLQTFVEPYRKSF